MSVISLLNEPNISSPANVDASVAYRKWTAGEDCAYETRVKELVAQSREQAQLEGVTVPENIDAYCVKRPEEEVAELSDGGGYGGDDLDDYTLSDASFDGDDDEEEEEASPDGADE